MAGPSANLFALIAIAAVSFISSISPLSSSAVAAASPSSSHLSPSQADLGRWMREQIRLKSSRSPKTPSEWIKASSQDALGTVQTGFTADKATYTVKLLPNSFNSSNQYAGYIPLTTDKTRQLFFWYYPSTNSSSHDLVLWLNGGPGCSSLFGDFAENGPYMIQADGTFHSNPYSWHLTANVLYVEQPVGTGFSYSSNVNGYAVNEYDIAADFYTFLDGFYGVFPETKPFNLFITGESYAGFYIPYIGEYLLDVVHLSDSTSINLRGLAIGNGIIDAINQGSFASAVNDFDYLNEAGFFGNDTAALERSGRIAQACLYATSANYTDIDYQCDMYSYMSDWRANATFGRVPCTNIYNINQTCDATDAQQMKLDDFLNMNSVETALHVIPLPVNSSRLSGWTQCSDKVGQYLTENVYTTNYIIPKVIDKGVPVFLYDGNLDFILHYVGLERAIGNMTWAGKTGFSNPSSFPPKSPNWKSPDGTTVYGYMLENDRGLYYYRVFKAGHMVPGDQPAAAQDILQRLLAAPISRMLPPNGAPVSVNTATGTVPVTDPGSSVTATASLSKANGAASRGSVSLFLRLGLPLFFVCLMLM